METMLVAGIQYDIFFYNPNIHPVKEYEIRKNENIRFAEKNGIGFIDADYDVDNWFERIKGLENEPERGERCTQCFDMRFERTALYAFEHGYDTITSSLGISRWKDMNQINGSGERAAARYENLLYWTYNWRKHGGSARMKSFISKSIAAVSTRCEIPTGIDALRVGIVLHWVLSFMVAKKFYRPRSLKQQLQ